MFPYSKKCLLTRVTECSVFGSCVVCCSVADASGRAPFDLGAVSARTAAVTAFGGSCGNASVARSMGRVSPGVLVLTQRECPLF